MELLVSLRRLRIGPNGYSTGWGRFETPAAGPLDPPVVRQRASARLGAKRAGPGGGRQLRVPSPRRILASGNQAPPHPLAGRAVVFRRETKGSA